MLTNKFEGTYAAAFSCIFLFLFSITVIGQAKRPVKKAPAAKPPASTASVKPTAGAPLGPKVNRVDDAGFRKLLVPDGKPLMINFWATWCGPCREEFPDLVKLDAEFKDKIDFITVTLDFEEEIATGVPKFLAENKAQMPTFLLVTPDETAAIAAVSKEWAGALPFTVIYGPDGTLTFFHQGKVIPQAVRSELNKLITGAKPVKSTP